MKKFLLLSDIHACDVDPSSAAAPSYVTSFSAGASAQPDPLIELERLILGDNNLSPDYILCAGDITNRSEPSSFTYAWSKLHGLAKSCSAKLISTVGNHDIDSRYQANSYDPRGYAMSIQPKIPVGTRTKFLEFWAEHFTLVSDKECNILVLNTAAFHGLGDDAEQELEHGRVSDITLTAIKKTLDSAPSAPVNILLCHHHLVRAERNDHELQGQTRGGDKLITALEQRDEPWIVVHGHMHAPDLFYSHGGSNSPVIIGCASFSAQVNVDAQNKNPNQVHLLVCDPGVAKLGGLTSAGHLESWQWQPGVGWKAAFGLHGLPHFAGFGFRNDIKDLAQGVDQQLTNTDNSKIPWDQAVKNQPMLGCIIPSDFERLERALDKLKIRILSSHGIMEEVGRYT